MTGKNVLVIEDDSKTANRIMEILESEGYAVFVSSNKEAAVELGIKIMPCVVFVSAILSGASGLEVTRAIREVEILREIPFIMMTEMEEAYSDKYKATYGIVNFLKKPIEKRDLLSKTMSATQIVAEEDHRSLSATGMKQKDAEKNSRLPADAEKMIEDDLHDLAMQAFEDAKSVDEGRDKKDSSEVKRQKTDNKIRIKVKAKDKSESKPEKAPEMKPPEESKPKQAPKPEQKYDAEEDRKIEEKHFDFSKTEEDDIESIEKAIANESDSNKDLVREERGDPKIAEESRHGLSDSVEDTMEASKHDEREDAAMTSILDRFDSDEESHVFGSVKDITKKKRSGSGNILEMFSKKKIIAFGIGGMIIVGGLVWLIPSFITKETGVRMSEQTMASDTGKERAVSPTDETGRQNDAEVENGERGSPSSLIINPIDKKGEDTEEQVETLQIVEEQKPSPPAEEEKPSQEKEKSITPAVTGQYSVQVGVFRKESNAESLFNSLKKKEYSVTVKKTAHKGSVVYRVLIGQYTKKREALRMVKNIKRNEKMDAALYRHK